MRRFVDLLLPVLTVGLMVTGMNDLAAQQLDHDHEPLIDAAGRAYTCGTHYMSEYDYEAALERTRINSPQMYAQLVAQAEGKWIRPNLAATDDIILPFNMNDRDNPGEFTQIYAKLVHQGDSILIWVDVRDTARIRASTITALAKGLESEVKNTPHTRDPNTGIVGNDIAIFGPPPTPIEDAFPGYICSFLLTDISEGQLVGGFIEGFFSPWDQTTNPGSNRTNILYIDSREGVGNQSADAIDGVIGTMAHEFQHLINHGRYTGVSADESAHWIYNEGLSEVASIRNGYTERSASQFLANPNLYSYFTRPNSGTDGGIVLRGYERAMLFIHYLSERFGDEFLYDLTAAGGVGLQPVKTAMEQNGFGSNVEEVWSDFWVANYLRNTTSFTGDAKYVYRDPVHTTMARETVNGVPGSPQNYQVDFVGHGAYAQQFLNSDADGTGLKVRFNVAGRPYGVHAIVTRPSGSIEVARLQAGQDYTFEDFSRVGFAIANVGSEGNTVSWTVEGTTLGVEDYRSTPEFGLQNVAPNPTAGSGVIDFMTGLPSLVGIDIYDVRGHLVRTVADAEHFEAGLHRMELDLDDLEPGVYTIRLTDDQGNVAVRQIVVVR